MQVVPSTLCTLSCKVVLTYWYNREHHLRLCPHSSPGNFFFSESPSPWYTWLGIVHLLPSTLASALFYVLPFAFSRYSHTDLYISAQRGFYLKWAFVIAEPPYLSWLGSHSAALAPHVLFLESSPFLTLHGMTKKSALLASLGLPFFCREWVGKCHASSSFPALKACQTISGVRTFICGCLPNNPCQLTPFLFLTQQCLYVFPLPLPLD